MWSSQRIRSISGVEVAENAPNKVKTVNQVGPGQDTSHGTKAGFSEVSNALAVTELFLGAVFDAALVKRLLSSASRIMRCLVVIRDIYVIATIAIFLGISKIQLNVSAPCRRNRDHTSLSLSITHH